MRNTHIWKVTGYKKLIVGSETQLLYSLCTNVEFLAKFFTNLITVLLLTGRHL